VRTIRLDTDDPIVQLALQRYQDAHRISLPDAAEIPQATIRAALAELRPACHDTTDRSVENVAAIDAALLTPQKGA